MENTFDLENYKGRSQAFIKHSLLKAYLMRLFMIIGQNERAIRYVVFFADKTGKKPRVAYVKVLDPFKDRTKYDLIYITRHPKGVVVFMDESEKLDLVQKKVRAQVQQEKRINNSGQQELFSPAMPEAEDEGVDLEVVKNYWLKKLSFKPIMHGEEQLADMLEDTGWFQSDFQRAFNELLDECKVKNLDAIRRRPKKAVHFDKNEFLMKL